MTSHEFARKLLEMEDLPLAIYDPSWESSIEVSGEIFEQWQKRNCTLGETYTLAELGEFGIDITDCHKVLEIQDLCEEIDNAYVKYNTKS